MSALLESMPFDSLTEQMHWAVFYGFGVAELNYAKDGAQVVLLDDVDDAGIYQGLKIKDRRRFVFHREDGLRMLTQQASFLGESLPPRKFWVLSTGSQISDDPHGLGLAYLCYYPNRFRRDNFKNWLRYGDKVSKNQIYGRTPHSDGKKREEFRKVVNALREGGSGVIDEEEVIEMLDMATNSSDYAVLDERIDNALAKIILGQVGTSEGVAGQHRGDMQRDVRQDFVSRDSYLITDAWNRGPGAWLTNWNFPGAVPPILSRQVEGKPSPEEQSDNDAKIFAFGWTKNLEQVSEHYGEGYLGVGKDGSMPAIPVDRLQYVLDLLSKVASGELTVDQGRKLALYMLPGYTEEMINELVVEPPEEPDAGPLFGEAIAGGLEPEEEPAFAAPDQDDIDLYGLDLQEQAAKTINQWLGQIRELGQDSVDLPEFAARIYDLYPDLSGQALTEVMAQAQMAASWIGADEAQGSNSPEFAAKAKTCKTGKTCGNSCISKNKECRKKAPEKAVRAVKAVAIQLDEKDEPDDLFRGLLSGLEDSVPSPAEKTPAEKTPTEKTPTEKITTEKEFAELFAAAEKLPTRDERQAAKRALRERRAAEEKAEKRRVAQERNAQYEPELRAKGGIGGAPNGDKADYIEAIKEKFAKDEDFKVAPIATGVAGTNIKYRMEPVAVQDVLPRGLNKEAVKEILSKSSGRAYDVIWDVYRRGEELDVYGGDANKFDKDEALKVALTARRGWKEKIQGRLKEGDLLMNTPSGGKDNPRAKAYERQGFSAVHANGYQYAMVGKGGKLIPIQFGDLA
jgi:hypothetical protein